MQVVIVIRKEVANDTEAKDTYNEIKLVCHEIEKLKFTANYSTHLESVET